MSHSMERQSSPASYLLVHEGGGHGVLRLTPNQWVYAGERISTRAFRRSNRTSLVFEVT